MKREILFRGINFQKEWVYGDLIHSYANDDVAIVYYKEGSKTPIFDAVFPESVGQYTGLKDKNGKKIFEGDIIESKGYRHIVKYDNSMCSYRAWCPLVHNNWEKGNIISKKWINECGKIVIGNVTDNPELLK